jgi:hypothetical protein
MKHTELEMAIIAKKIVKDLHQEFYDENSISGLMYEDQVAVRILNNQIMNIWTVFIDSKLGSGGSVLKIDDETGEPICIQTSILEPFLILKDKQGNYDYGKRYGE